MTITELEPIYSAQQSFNRKAMVIDNGNIKNLLSYETVVATYDKIKNKLTVNDYYSATTSKHIKEFAHQLGFKTGTGRQMTTEKESEK